VFEVGIPLLQVEVFCVMTRQLKDLFVQYRAYVFAAVIFSTQGLCAHAGRLAMNAEQG